MDGWKTIISFWETLFSIFRGELVVFWKVTVNVFQMLPSTSSRQVPDKLTTPALSLKFVATFIYKKRWESRWIGNIFRGGPKAAPVDF